MLKFLIELRNGGITNTYRPSAAIGVENIRAAYRKHCWFRHTDMVLRLVPTYVVLEGTY